MLHMKNRKKILLVCLYDFESFGIRSLAANLKKNHISFNLLFFQNLEFNNLKVPVDADWQCLLDFIGANEFEYIGISFRSPTFMIARNMTAQIRNVFKNRIIWGGSHATVEPDDCLNYADVVFTGEAEENLCQFLSSENDSIPGVYLKNQQKKSEIILVENLDAIPPPLYENATSFYQINDQIFPGDPLLIGNYMEKYGEPFTYETMTSRGCPFNCTYCSSPMISKRRVRVRKVENIINELLEIKKIMRIERINFIDEVFGFDMNWLREFSNAYKKQINIPYTAEIHPSMITIERINEYIKSGMTGVELGIQSGSENIRINVYNRIIKQQTIINNIHLLVNSGIQVSIDIIIDNPYETEEDLKETFNLIMNIPRSVALKVFSLTHLPKTQLTQRLIDEKIIQTTDIEHYSCKTHKMWRARINNTREKWRQYWSNLIILSSIRNLEQNQNWLATPTSLDANVTNIHKFSIEYLRNLVNDEKFYDNPLLLENIILDNVHISQKSQI